MLRAAFLALLCFQMLPLSASVEEQVLTEKELPAEVEIVNPMRGLYTWLDFDQAPQPERALNRYKRFTWAGLEPQESRYDFSQIEAELAKVPKGGGFGFRIMAMNPSWSWHDGSDIPPYLMAAMPRGFYVPVTQKTPSSPAHLYIPDWNSPAFLDRLDKLMAALGSKYDGDPRIAFIDIGVYGTWGEWHTYGMANYPGSLIPYWNITLNRQGASAGTLETKKRIIDAHVKAFKKTQLVMMTDDKDALCYALRLPAPVPVGMRRDSFGAKHFEEHFVEKTMPAADQDLVLNRWKTAPVVVEEFGPPKAFEVGPQGLVEQVEHFHVSAIGNGNFGDWTKVPAEDQQAVLKAGRRAGYRYAITEADLPADIKRGMDVTLRSKWENLGVAPSYDQWTVEFALWKERGEHPAAQVASSLNFKALLPGTTPLEVKDVLPLSKVSKGAYELRVKVSDPACYRNPMRLAMEGAAADGSYLLGTIHVN